MSDSPATPELLYGERAPATVTAATTLDPGAAGDLELAEVEIHYCLFELPMATALARLPPSLHPSVPAHLGITFWRCSDGPLGPFTLAWLGLACRTGIKPRHLVHGSFIDCPEAGAWLRARYGLACAPARLHSLETYDRVHSLIECGGRTILDVTSTRPVPVVGRGATVKFSPALNAARCGTEVALVQMEASYAFERVARGVPAVACYDAAALGDAAVAPGYPMSGSVCRASVSLHAPRFRLSPDVPAERGGARRL